MDDHISAREFGRLESEVSTLTELVKAQTAAMQLMSARLDTMNQTLTEAKGGWRMLMMLGGVAGLIGTFLGWFLTHTIHITPKP
jgi:hypothetical protein